MRRARPPGSGAGGAASVLGLAAIVVLVGWPAGPASAKCFVTGYFRLASEGPWPFHAIVDRDSACRERTFHPRNTVVLKRLNAYELPSHGRLALHEGGRWSYRPAPGFVGQDRFLLEICGSWATGEGCSKLAFDVQVR